ncbi:MAG: hypothetical protein GY839_10825 [candidate division Zixibacteria bacterium]|nr:hypothetical protein [candidate division Zixibacteria bacterium]
MKPILGSIQKDNDPRWNIVVTALLWNALGSIFGKKKSYDEEHLDDLWQNINWVFIETVRSLDLNRFTEKYAYLIYLKTQNALYAKYQSPRKIDRYEFPVKPQILDYVLPFEDLSLNKLEHINPVDDGKDPDVESGNISIRTYLKAVKVADTEFENITSPINLDWLLRHGVISHSEHYLLERTLRYEESMAECAEYLGLSYEAAKKQRQRALKKIKENENSVSP